MTQQAAPFVLEQAVVTGTNSVTLTGTTISGFYSFASTFGDGAIVPYIIVDTIAGYYEYGQGTLNSGTLARTLPQGYGGGATSLPVSFGGNLCNIYTGDPGPVVASSGSSSMGRIPMLNSAGQLDASFVSGIVAGSVLINYGTTGAVSAPLVPMVSNIINPVGFNASGSQQTTYVTSSTAANATNIVVSSVIDFVSGQGIYISGGGAGGVPYIGTVVSINSATNTITVSPNITTATTPAKTFNATFLGNYMTLVGTPSSPIYPGDYVTFSSGSTTFTILALYSGSANSNNAVYTISTSITTQVLSRACKAYSGVQHDDTAALNNAINTASQFGVGMCAVNCGGLQYNTSSPIVLQSNTRLEDFDLLLAPGTAGNFYCIPQWQSWMNYSVGQQVTSNGNQYICTTAGTSAWSSGNAGTGISGTSSGITDGTVVWNYVSAASTTNAMIYSSSSTSNAYVANCIIDINRVPNVYGITGRGTSGVKYFSVQVKHWAGTNIGFYVAGKTQLSDCQAAQYNSSDYETNFPNLYYSGYNYFFDYTTGGAGGGATDSIAINCTASAGSSRFFLAQGTNHIRLLACHPFSAIGQAALTRSNFQNWANATSYVVNARVVNGLSVYICVTAGTSSIAGDGPVGLSNGIVDGTVVWNYYAPIGNGAWAQNTTYALNNVVSNNSQAYQATTAGTSASTGTGPFQNPIYITYKATGCSVSGVTLTVPTANVVTNMWSVPSLAVGMILIGTGITTGTYVTAVGSTSGGNTTYTLSNNLGTLSSLTITSFSIPDGTVVWTPVGPAPGINAVNMEIRAGSTLIDNTYLDNGSILIYVFKPNNVNIIISSTNSLYNTATVQLSSWINIIAGVANSTIKGLYIGSDNNWIGGIPVFNQNTVNGGSFLNYNPSGSAQALIQSDQYSLITSRGGFTVYESSPSAYYVAQFISLYEDITSTPYSWITFLDQGTTDAVSPRLGSSSNTLVFSTSGQTQMTISQAGGVATNVAAITGGTIDNTVIGGSTPAAGTFTNLTVNGTLSASGFSGPTGSYAPLASPAFTGTPTAPTAATSTNDTQIATTAFNYNLFATPPAIGNSTPNSGAFTNLTSTGSLVVNTSFGYGLAINSSSNANGANIQLIGNGTTTPSKYIRVVDGNFQVVNSPYTAIILNLDDTGDLSITGALATATLNLNNGSIANVPANGNYFNDAAVGDVAYRNTSGALRFGASTSYSQIQITSSGVAFTTTGGTALGSITSTGLNSMAVGATTASTGAFTTLTASSTVSGAGFTSLLSPYAPLASPSLTGTPTAPTASAGTNTTQIATTAYTNTIFAAPPALGATTPASVKATTIVATSTITPSTTSGVVGTTLADSANAGSVGEYVSSFIQSGSAISITSGSGTNLTSISLTAGDWDVEGIIGIAPAATTLITSVRAGINTASNTIPTTIAGGVVTLYLSSGNIPAGDNVIFPVGATRINVSTTTNVYFVVNCQFTTSTCAAFGGLFARRRR